MSDGGTEHARRLDAKLRAARAFDGAVRECALTNGEVAAPLAVRDTRVKNYRSDDPSDADKVPSTADLLLAPPELFAAWLARLQAERLELHGPPRATATLEGTLCLALEADAAVQAATMRALRDGHVTPAEVPDIESALHRSQAEREAAVRLLRARGRR